jgi:hypothetical protein
MGISFNERQRTGLSSRDYSCRSFAPNHCNDEGPCDAAIS